MDTRKVVFFVGIEQERTPAQGLKTLFVVGAPPAHDIVALAVERRVQHVFLGANHARNERIERFDPAALDWPRLIDELLSRNLRVTVEYLPAHHDWAMQHLRPFFQRPGFCAQIAIALPDDTVDGSRLAVKIDNLAGAQASRGVWVWPLAMLRAEHRHTPFMDSPNDEVVGRSG